MEIIVNLRWLWLAFAIWGFVFWSFYLSEWIITLIDNRYRKRKTSYKKFTPVIIGLIIFSVSTTLYALALTALH